LRDVNAQLERARAHGAKVVQEPTAYPYGERECTIEDLAGHRWQFTQSVQGLRCERGQIRVMVEAYPPPPG
jgi:uncharacterized glyoxalase superfamily protein PhnB